jgi:glycosyltransferase involved in cell wall biosynthesis
VLASRCDPARSAGGIEAFIAELAPRLRELHPEWNVTPIYAFVRAHGWNKIPFLCDVVAGVRLWRLARSADVVIVNGAEYVWLMAFDPAFRSKTLVVWHGTRAFEIPALTPKMSLPVSIYWTLERWLQGFAFRFARHVAVAPSVVDEIRTTYRRAPAIKVVINGAPSLAAAPDLAARGNAFVVVWSGTNAYKKGLDLAVAACREARIRIPQLELHVFGMPRDPALDAEWIAWHGLQPRPVALAAVAGADAYLATTRYEACSIAVLEALALGTPIVGSPAIAWMLDEVGIAVADYAPRSFAAALATLPSQTQSRSERIARARSTLARFDWNDAAKAYAGTIQDVLAAASNRSSHA